MQVCSFRPAPCGLAGDRSSRSLWQVLSLLPQAARENSRCLVAARFVEIKGSHLRFALHLRFIADVEEETPPGAHDACALAAWHQWACSVRAVADVDTTLVSLHSFRCSGRGSSFDAQGIQGMAFGTASCFLRFRCKVKSGCCHLSAFVPQLSPAWTSSRTCDLHHALDLRWRNNGLQETGDALLCASRRLDVSRGAALMTGQVSSVGTVSSGVPHLHHLLPMH